MKLQKQSSQKKKKKSGCLKIIIGFIFLVFIAGHFISPELEKTSSNSNKESTKPEMTREQMAAALVIKIFGEKSNIDGKNKIISLSSIPQYDNTLALDVKLRIDDNLTQRYIVVGYLNHVMKLMQQFFADPNMNDYNELRVYGAFPMKDMHGNVKEDIISKIFLTRSTAAKINWDNLTADEFHKLMTRINDGKNCTYWMHGSASAGANLK